MLHNRLCNKKVKKTIALTIIVIMNNNMLCIIIKFTTFTILTNDPHWKSLGTEADNLYNLLTTYDVSIEYIRI